MNYRLYIMTALFALLGMAAETETSAVFAQSSGQNSVVIQVQPSVPAPVVQSSPSQMPAADNTSPYTFYKKGQHTQAISKADEIIQRDKHNISAYAVKGWSLLSLKRWNEALNTALQAYEFAKNDRRIVEIIGEAYYGIGDYDRALPFFERYLAIAPGGKLTGSVYYCIGMIYYNKQKFNKADIALSAALDVEKARGSGIQIQWLLSLAQVKEKRQRIEEALKTYKEVLSQSPENVAAHAAINRLSSM